MDTINYGPRKCGYCQEEISAGARRCPYCGSLADSDSYLNNVPAEKPPADTNQQEIFIDHQPEGNAQHHLDEEKRVDLSKNDNIGSDIPKDQISTESPMSVPASQEGNHFQRPSYPNAPQRTDLRKEALGNGLKVFWTTLSNVVPGIGQLAGIIVAIVYMNSEDDDRRSFGLALLTSSIIVFFIMLFACCALLMAYSLPVPQVD
ncbi:MAG: hypothetical protein N2645_10220 [Clostridia bacterium]|nr:hypothetical protein [Clostridia bacterium]